MQIPAVDSRKRGSPRFRSNLGHSEYCSNQLAHGPNCSSTISSRISNSVPTVPVGMLFDCYSPHKPFWVCVKIGSWNPKIGFRVFLSDSSFFQERSFEDSHFVFEFKATPKEISTPKTGNPIRSSVRRGRPRFDVRFARGPDSWAVQFEVPTSGRAHTMRGSQRCDAFSLPTRIPFG